MFAGMKKPIPPQFAMLLCLLFMATFKLEAQSTNTGRPYPDRFVWVFGWSLDRDADLQSMTRLIETAGAHGLNGAVLSANMDTLCKQSPDYFTRLEALQKACDRNHVELIPSLFSVGYGGGALAHNPNLAEGFPVENAPFVVSNGVARFQPSSSIGIVNGGFESFTGQNLKGFNFHDQPGTVSFIDTQTVHSGSASLRLENFTANPYGHGRVMQEIKLIPHRCYRLRLWVKTDGLTPASAFQMTLLAKDREIAPRSFNLPATTGWREITTDFNSLEYDRINLYAGVWGAKSGRLWLDDWSLEEVGPVNVLNRPGTPVTVRSEEGDITYSEGKDYAPLKDSRFALYRPDHEAALLQIPSGSRIKNGQRLRVSWFHPEVIYDGQITVCMAEPELYEIFDHEAALMAKHLQPRRFLLNMDEIRMGGTCQACAGKNMGELLGQCVTRQAEILKRHFPGAQIYVWSDMFDPNHNAHGNYYLVSGDFTGSWKHIPKDLVMAVWSGEPRPKSLRFFAEQGFSTLAACYYDADDLNDVKGWLEQSKNIPGVRGFMYTPWLKKYDLLADFADLIGKGN
jgi:hypothetical protein